MKTRHLLQALAAIILSVFLFSFPFSALAQPADPQSLDNTPPVANDQTVNTNEETSILINLSADDPDPGDQLDFTILSQPSHGELTGSNRNPTYTPAIDFYGQDSFTFKVNDGTDDSNIATITINVTNINDAPIAVDDSYETKMDEVLVVLQADSVLENDSDADGDELTTLLVTDVSHGMLTLSMLGNGAFVYKPDQGYTGLDTFTYKAFDSETLSNAATVTITVGVSENVLPVAVADSYDAVCGQLLTVDAANSVLVNDTDGDGDILTAELVGTTAQGTLTFNSDGTFTYLSGYAYTGDDHFTYKALDEVGASNPVMVTITVNPAPLTPLYLPIIVSAVVE